MPDIPTIEPTEFIAGDTVKWTRDLSDYPAGTWTLTYYFRGNVKKEVLCTVSSGLHLATISAATSATFPPGEYFVFARASYNGEEFTIWQGRVTVKENPETGSSAQDRRSHAKKMLDAIEAMMEGVASRFEASYEVSAPGMTSRRLETCNRLDLIKFHAHYKQLYAQEMDAERIAQGKKPRNRILTVFTR